MCRVIFQYEDRVPRAGNLNNLTHNLKAMVKRRSIQQLRRDGEKAKRRRASEQPLPEVEVEVEVEAEAEAEIEQAVAAASDLEPRHFAEILNSLGIQEYLLDSSGADSKSRWRYEPTTKTTVARLAAFLFFVRPETPLTKESIRDSLLSIEAKDISSYLQYSCDVLKRAPSTVSKIFSLSRSSSLYFIIINFVFPDL
jgi:hypothetical protein